MKVVDHISNAKQTLFSLEILPPLKGQDINSIFKSAMSASDKLSFLFKTKRFGTSVAPTSASTAFVTSSCDLKEISDESTTNNKCSLLESSFSERLTFTSNNFLLISLGRERPHF